MQTDDLQYLEQLSEKKFLEGDNDSAAVLTMAVSMIRKHDKIKLLETKLSAAVDAETIVVAKVGVLSDGTKGITWLDNRHLKEGDKLYAKCAPAAAQSVRDELDNAYCESVMKELRTRTAAAQVGGTDSLVHSANGPAPAAPTDQVSRGVLNAQQLQIDLGIVTPKMEDAGVAAYKAADYTGLNVSDEGRVAGIYRAMFKAALTSLDRRLEPAPKSPIQPASTISQESA